MQSLSSLEPGNAMQNTVYLATSVALVLLITSIICAIFQVVPSSEEYGQILLFGGPILAVFLYYWRADKRRAETVFKELLEEERSMLKRYVVRFSYLLKTWDTTIAVHNNPLSIIDDSIDSVVRGKSFDRDLWSERIALFIRVIIFALVVSAGFQIEYQLMDYQTYRNLWGVSLIVSIEAFGLGLHWLFKNWDNRSDTYNLYISGYIIAIEILLIYGFLIWNSTLITSLLLTLPFAGLFDIQLLRWIDLQRNESLEHALTLVRVRTLQTTIVYDKILSEQPGTSGRYSDEVTFRETLLSRIGIIESSLLRSDWGFVQNQTELLVNMVEHLADEAIVGRHGGGHDIHSRLISSWRNIMDTKKVTDWAHFIWLRTLAYYMIELDMQPPNRDIMKALLKLDALGIQNPHSYAALIGDEVNLGVKTRPEIIEILKQDFESGEFRQKSLVTEEEFLKSYIKEIKGWKYEYISDLIKRTPLQSLNLPEIEDALRSTLRRNPKDTKAYIGLAAALWTQERIKEALEAIEIAMKRDSSNWLSWMLKGGIHNSLKQHSEAVASHNRALEIRKNDSDTLKSLANSYFLNDELEKSEEAILQVIKQEPDSAESFSHLGSIRDRQGKSEESKEAYSKAISIDFKHEKSYYYLARLLADEESYLEVIEILARAVYLVPSGRLYSELGNAHSSIGNFPEADEAFEEAWKLDPIDEMTAVRISEHWIRKKDIEKAEKWAGVAVKLDENSYSAILNLVYVLEEKKSYNEALVELQKFERSIHSDATYSSELKEDIEKHIARIMERIDRTVLDRT